MDVSAEAVPGFKTTRCVEYEKGILYKMQQHPECDNDIFHHSGYRLFR